MRILFVFLFLVSNLIFGQQTYYNDVNLNLSGMALKNALATKITDTHTNILSYSEAENALRVTDLDPDDNTDTNLLLIYGFSSSICPSSTSDDNDHRRRDKNSDGGGSTCEWNREHTYAKSLGTPNLGESGPGADAHHLRASDVQRNGDRGSEKFVDGSGTSHDVTSSTWYPGDEWKGDVARMMMYMYLRYGNQCLPDNVGNGNPVSNDVHMIDLFLEWNIEDPVSQVEINRNEYLGNANNSYGQGNRNPFIDNPYLATRIWGGLAAQDTWGIYLSNEDYFSTNFHIYPNPAHSFVFVENNDESRINSYDIFSILGERIQSGQLAQDNSISVENIATGMYWLQVNTDTSSSIEKIIIQ
jgi:endonuclease I